MTIESTSYREPSLSEMVADPIVQSVMIRDGVTMAELESLISAVAKKLDGGRPARPQTSQQEPRATALAG